ncbi:hypothetical protein [Streptomyces sp. NPDC127084]|uniref:hypothetical protein n=1 Tax=Streptomyces sp. NPDC127084 TaxID=3347133 RepID=UPI00365EF25A
MAAWSQGRGAWATDYGARYHKGRKRRRYGRVGSAAVVPTVSETNAGSLPDEQAAAAFPRRARRGCRRGRTGRRAGPDAAGAPHATAAVLLILVARWAGCPADRVRIDPARPHGHAHPCPPRARRPALDVTTHSGLPARARIADLRPDPDHVAAVTVLADRPVRIRESAANAKSLMGE